MYRGQKRVFMCWGLHPAVIMTSPHIDLQCIRLILDVDDGAAPTLWGLRGLGSIKTGPKRCIGKPATGSGWPRVVVVWCFGQTCCWETLGPAFSMDDSLICTSYLSPAADPVGCGLFQLDNNNKAQMLSGMFRSTQIQVLVPNSPRSQSKQASLGCAGQTGVILGGFSSWLTGLKGSAANISESDTTALLQGSGEGHAWMGQGCFRSRSVYINGFWTGPGLFLHATFLSCWDINAKRIKCWLIVTSLFLPQCNESCIKAYLHMGKANLALKKYNEVSIITSYYMQLLYSQIAV